MEQLRQRVIASCHLNPLSEEETREYIEHRLGVVGWRGDPHFTEDAYAVIHRYAEGIPRRINIFCDRLLLYGFLEELHEFSEAVTVTVSQEMHEEMGKAAEAAPEPALRESGPPIAQWNAQIDNLERRVSELEHVVDRLRRGFLQLAGEPSER